MTVRSVFSIFIAMLGVAFCASADQPVTRGEHVSIIQLIATPEKYHGHKVIVTGVLRIKFEENSLYLAMSDYRNHISKNSLWIGFGKNVSTEEGVREYEQYYSKLKPFSGKYVVLEGTFSKDEMGHLDCCSGGIMDVTRIYNN